MLSGTETKTERREFSLAERFEFGLFTIAEICELTRRSKAAVYADITSGLLPIEKRGRSTRVRGPVAKRYINGEAAR